MILLVSSVSVLAANGLFDFDEQRSSSDEPAKSTSYASNRRAPTSQTLDMNALKKRTDAGQATTVYDTDGKRHVIRQYVNGNYIDSSGMPYSEAEMSRWTTRNALPTEPRRPGEKTGSTTLPSGQKATALSVADALRAGLTAAEYRLGTRLYVDKNGNVVDANGRSTGVVKVGTDFYNVGDNFVDNTNELRMFDPNTGLMIERRNKDSPWFAVSDDLRYDTRFDLVLHRMYGLDIGFDMFVATDEAGVNFYYVVDPKTNKFSYAESSSAFESALQSKLEETFGQNWANRYARGTVEEMINNVQKRRDVQAMWRTFWDGSPSLISQSVEAKFNRKFWSDVIKEWDWLESTFFTPEKWEQEICQSWFNKEADVPSYMSTTDTSYGRDISMSLFAEKEHFDVLNQTLYQVSWMIAPNGYDVEYSICLNKCGSSCKLVAQGDADDGDVESGFKTKYRDEDDDETKASICYDEIREVDGDEQRTTKSFTVPIVHENYRSEFDGEISAYGNTASSVGNVDSDEVESW
ncbi:hypothetical protein KY316_00950, partial [Candidatus Woesearchaeota archaeon]|nr:hypothetical protein [Candidatus Woesearchaeota archaeon]